MLSHVIHNLDNLIIESHTLQYLLYIYITIINVRYKNYIPFKLKRYINLLYNKLFYLLHAIKRIFANSIYIRNLIFLRAC